MDILTSAPIGTQITLQLENSSLNAGVYPIGRRSSYIGFVSKQNEWHTIRFNFNQIISTATLPDQVDHIALLFDPGHLTADVYYFDNFRRLSSSEECAYLHIGIKELEIDNLINIYPNPVTNTLYINEKNKSQQVSIYNYLGEKIIEINENKENKIDVSHLPNGIYFFKTERNIFKFVKE